MNPRRSISIAATAPLLALASCQSSTDKADAYESLYDYQMARAAYPAALRSIQTAVDNDDSNARRYLKKAQVEMLLNKPTAASSSFQRALDLEPSNVEALQNLSILAVRGRQFQAAKRYVQPLLALSPDDPAGLLASGAIAIYEHQYQDAIRFADRVISALPSRGDGYILKARALDALGRTREATRLLESRVAPTDDPRDVLSQLMFFYRKLGDIRGIRATALRMAPLFPNDPRYALESARAYAAEGKPDKVREVIEGLRRRFAQDPGVIAAIADFWRATEPVEAARAKTAELASASSPTIRSVLADRLIDMGDPQRAVALLAPLAPAEVTSANVDKQNRYARALLASGKTAEAQAKVDAILAYDDSNPDALLLRARLKLLRRDFRGAFTDAQLVANGDDENEDAALLVAEIHVAQGNNALAAGAFGDARQKFPHSARALKAETDWLLSLHRDDEAAQKASFFYHIHPRNGDAAQIYNGICRKVRSAACKGGTPNQVKLAGT